MEAPVLPANREATPPTALVPAAASSSNALPAALRPPAPQIRRSASQHRPPLRSLLANAVVRAGDSPRLQPWRTRSLTPDQRRPVSSMKGRVLSRGRLEVVDVRTVDRMFGRAVTVGVAGVPGLCLGLVAGVPGEP